MIPMSARCGGFLLVVLLLLMTSPPCSSSNSSNSSSNSSNSSSNSSSSSREHEILTRPRVRAGPGRVEVRRRSVPADASTGICDGIIRAAGYPCEEITVETSDGFLLEMQRIPHGQSGGSNRKRKRPPVFLQHGLTQGGDDWVLNSPTQSLAYILADHDFDVWIGNLRGTRFGRRHKTLSPNDQKFWDWTFNEHASLDLPAMLRGVLKSTGSKGVYYVGHSQGSMMVLAAMSEAETGLSEMVKAAVLLAPVAYMQHMNSPLLSISAGLMLDTIVGLFGTREFNLKNEVGEQLVNIACAEPNVVCDSLVEAFTGPNCCYNTTRSRYYSQWEPQSTSTKNLQHLAQMMRSGRFEKFDYGWLGNAVQYQRGAPPGYDLAKVPVATKVMVISGGRDALADPSDVQRLRDELRCSVRSLELPSYGHADFVVGTHAHVDVYPPIIQYFRSLEG